MTCNRELREPLLQMAIWQAKVAYGWHYDTLYEGRYIQRWATPQVQEALPATYPQFDADSLRDALIATVDLFTQLDEQIAPALGCSYPDTGVEPIRAHVLSMLRNFDI